MRSFVSLDFKSVAIQLRALRERKAPRELALGNEVGMLRIGRTDERRQPSRQAKTRG